MENLKTTPLHERHIEAGASMSPFGGFDMPIEYEGIVAEHEAVRRHVGVFDVSHMGEVAVSGPEAMRFVNYIFTNDVAALPVVADGIRNVAGLLLQGHQPRVLQKSYLHFGGLDVND